MNEQYKEITRNMTNLLSRHTLLFMAGHFDNTEQDTSDLINLVLSAHLSAAWDVMLKLTDDNPPMRKVVKKFIADLSESIVKLDPINEVELQYND